MNEILNKFLFKPFVVAAIVSAAATIFFFIRERKKKKEKLLSVGFYSTIVSMCLLVFVAFLEQYERNKSNDDDITMNKKNDTIRLKTDSSLTNTRVIKTLDGKNKISGRFDKISK